MRVLVLTPYPYGKVAGPRSSFELWERVLRDAGIELDYLVFESERLHEIIYEPGRMAEKAIEMASSYGRMLRSVGKRDYDAVLVNREAALIGPAIIERWACRGGKPMLYLIDDPLYVPYRSPSNGFLSYLKFFGKVKALCRMSSVVLANSPQHVEFASRYNGNVWEIPSVVDAEEYSGWVQRPRSDTVCVGWTGSRTTVPNLQVVRRPLARLSQRDDVVIRLIGATDFGLPDVAHEGLPWCAETEVEDLRALEVGLLPVPESPWTKRKFYLKLVQYMALGIPPVATPLGATPSVVENGVTGMLAASDEEWLGAVERLVEDRELREQMGQRAAEVAHRRYTLQSNAERIVAAFRSALPQA